MEGSSKLGNEHPKVTVNSFGSRTEFLCKMRNEIGRRYRD